MFYNVVANRRQPNLYKIGRGYDRSGKVKAAELTGNFSAKRSFLLRKRMMLDRSKKGLLQLP